MMSERFQNWKRSSRFRPVFFLFLLLGPFVVLPILVVAPALVTFRVVWMKQPRIMWRCWAVGTVVLAFLLTQPSSPLFWRLDMPLPPPREVSDGASWLIEMQRPYLNAAIIFLGVALPLSMASAVDTIISRRRATNG